MSRAVCGRHHGASLRSRGVAPSLRSSRAGELSHIVGAHGAAARVRCSNLARRFLDRPNDGHGCRCKASKSSGPKYSASGSCWQKDLLLPVATRCATMSTFGPRNASNISATERRNARCGELSAAADGIGDRYQYQISRRAAAGVRTGPAGWPSQPGCGDARLACSPALRTPTDQLALQMDVFAKQPSRRRPSPRSDTQDLTEAVGDVRFGIPGDDTTVPGRHRTRKSRSACRTAKVRSTASPRARDQAKSSGTSFPRPHTSDNRRIA